MQRKVWDIAQFDAVNLPEVVGEVDPSFSDFQGIRVLDMPIHMPGQGWAIPDYIQEQFGEMIQQVIDAESRFGDFEQDHYVYITVDQKMVNAGKTGRRPGAHSDAYIEQKGEQFDITTENADVVAAEQGEVSHTYICADVFPTEFFRARFPLTDTSCEGSLQTFDEIAETAEVVTYPAYTVLRLDPFVVHRSAVADRDTQRTFVKVSVSRKRYARQGNTRNEAFDYDWSLTARSPHERNHPW
jgi:hypothetical protein